MRIVAGTHRGRAIVAPKGHLTRPTADRTRQAIFDILEHAPWSTAIEGSRVLDLFAGSGAFGLEALSRGAACCLFIDQTPAARATIEANLIRLGWRDRGKARLLDATRLPPRVEEEPVSLAFLDPPYGGNLGNRALSQLVSGRWLACEAIVILEREASAGDLEPDEAWEALATRRWGAARVDFIRSRPPRTLAATLRARGRSATTSPLEFPMPTLNKTIAVLATDGFEQSELERPLAALKEAGARVEVVAPKAGAIQGWEHQDKGRAVPVDRALAEADPDQYDALVLPGGVMNPDALRLEPAAIDFVAAFVKAGKPIAAICHGPWTSDQRRRRARQNHDLVAIAAHRS